MIITTVGSVFQHTSIYRQLLYVIVLSPKAALGSLLQGHACSALLTCVLQHNSVPTKTCPAATLVTLWTLVPNSTARAHTSDVSGGHG